jgi:hypothetical protein
MGREKLGDVFEWDHINVFPDCKTFTGFGSLMKMSRSGLS